MKFSVNLFLTGAVLFILFQLSSQGPLEDLFSGSHGIVFPPVKSEPVFPKYRQYSGLLFGKRVGCSPSLLHSNSRLAVRGHVVIGVMVESYITPVTNVNGRSNLVYKTLPGDILGNWVELTSEDLEKLGIGQRILFVQTIDKIILNHVQDRPEIREREHARRMSLEARNRAHSQAISQLYAQEEENRRSLLPVNPETIRTEYSRCLLNSF